VHTRLRRSLKLQTPLLFGPMIDYDLESDKVSRFLKKHRVKCAGIQLPAGLRPFWQQISENLQNCGAKSIFLGSCYGACDLADADAKRLGCDVLLHYGHSDMGLPTEIPTLYVEAKVSNVLFDSLEKLVKRIHHKRIGLLTTVQYQSHLPTIAKFLREEGISPMIGSPGPRTKYPGQILGCDFDCVKSISKRADAFVYFGTGKFHPLGAALATYKEVYIANPITGSLNQVGGLRDFLRSRKAIISRAASCQKFGVVTSVKKGQARLALANHLIEKLLASGRQATLIAMDEILPETLGDHRFEALVCAACPRIPIDDAHRYEVPLLTPFETMVMLGETQLEPYQIDEIKKKDFGKV